jgi:sugar lactone lactonase YvrE
MTRRLTALAAVLALAACKKAEQQAAADSTAVPRDSFTVADSFKTPESVLYDSVMDVYVVSNINGAPTAKDDNGFLSRVAPDGRVIELRWVDGAADSVTLNAPKGMGIKGDTLFVADIDEVRLFDRTTGRALGSRPVRGATFLNDITVGPDGTVYVSDTGLKPDFSSSGTDAVYRFDARGNAVALARGRTLGSPNGLFAYERGVVVVTFGSGEAYVLDSLGRRTDIQKPPHGQLDGVFMGAGGNLYASSWADSSVVSLRAGDTEWRPIIRGMVSPADIGLDTRRNRILIPLFQQDRIEVRPLR